MGMNQDDMGREVPDYIRTEIDIPNRTHVPKLERAAYNQMPKGNGWTDLKLWRFDGTDLYQWRGRPRIRGLSGAPYSVFEDQATEVFRIQVLDR